MKYFIRMHNSWSFKYALMDVKIFRMKITDFITNLNII